MANPFSLGRKTLFSNILMAYGRRMQSKMPRMPRKLQVACRFFRLLTRALTELERINFHRYNTTPDRPCTAYFQTDSFAPASEIFERFAKDGFTANQIRCLQRKPTGEVHITFINGGVRQAFLEQSAFVPRRRRGNTESKPFDFSHSLRCAARIAR